MTGPVGLPNGPDRKWKVPFYALRLAGWYIAALLNAALDALRTRRKGTEDT